MNWEIQEIEKNAIPSLLKEIPAYPEKMYLVGELPSNQHFKYLTVVGSRKYSDYSKQACKKLLSDLAGYPITIVSGLALGIDSIAHQEALETGLPTVAIPGSGLDPKNLYPRTNFNLAQKIIEAGGALLSEFSPETKATPYTFPQRNRIMAGISHATLVIEAGEKSGTLITARLALDYNREVLAVPQSIFSPSGRGSNNLLKLGATPITSSLDILEVLDIKSVEEKSADSLLEKILSPEEKIIHQLLKTEGLERDLIIIKSNLPANIINITLSQMEVRGLIKEIGGKFVLN